MPSHKKKVSFANTVHSKVCVCSDCTNKRKNNFKAKIQNFGCSKCRWAPNGCHKCRNRNKPKISQQKIILPQNVLKQENNILRQERLTQLQITFLEKELLQKDITLINHPNTISESEMYFINEFGERKELAEIHKKSLQELKSENKWSFDDNKCPIIIYNNKQYKIKFITTQFTNPLTPNNYCTLMLAYCTDNLYEILPIVK